MSLGRRSIQMTLTVNGITRKLMLGSTNMKDIVELDDETGQRMRAMEDQLKSMDPTERKKKLDEMSEWLKVLEQLSLV
ncbi:hypothetical protein H4Q26_011034 [Puccinia striiformis f. sp. tritici PST-130]|nr:hypothetical protein H4Q26_011034 [Puccinia striiformis f. sp. tritici PST-130]